MSRRVLVLGLIYDLTPALLLTLLRLSLLHTCCLCILFLVFYDLWYVAINRVSMLIGWGLQELLVLVWLLVGISEPCGALNHL